MPCLRTLPVGTRAVATIVLVAVSIPLSSGDQDLCELEKAGVLGWMPFSGNIILPKHTAKYEAARRQYAAVNFFNRTRPSVVAQVQTESDVQAAVLFARACNYTVRMRSGGHSYLALSSCDSSTTPCLQIDVGFMNHTKVLKGGKQLVAGPGIRLAGLADVLHEHGLFLPTGECAMVALGGHMQTGGVGMWARHFGVLSSQVDSFRIVLADGSAHKIVSPVEKIDGGGSIVKHGWTGGISNDDIFFAVLGGASGSWGVITEVTLNPVKNEDFFSVYWKVRFVWDTEGVVSMLRVWADLAAENKDDTRWSTHWTVGGVLPTGVSPNIIALEASWVSPKDQAGEYDAQFFQTIVDACVGCQIIDAVNVTEPMSSSLVNRYLCCEDGPEFPAFQYYEKSWQQTASFPDADATEAIVRKLDELLPAANSTYLLIFQLTTVLKPRDDPTISLPWPGDVVGVVCDFFFPDPRLAPFFKDFVNSFTEAVVDKFGEDHRAFWGAFGDPDLVFEWDKYYESEDKFKTLQRIKADVDPNNLFCNNMSVPLPDEALQSDDTAAVYPLRVDWMAPAGFIFALIVALRQ